MVEQKTVERYVTDAWVPLAILIFAQSSLPSIHSISDIGNNLKMARRAFFFGNFSFFKVFSGYFWGISRFHK